MFNSRKLNQKFKSGKEVNSLSVNSVQQNSSIEMKNAHDKKTGFCELRLKGGIYINYQNVKRAIDFLLSIIGGFILLPLCLILIVAIKTDSKGPILFTQKRVGIHKKNFYIFKFRTMRIDTPKDVATHLLDNPDKHITRVGRVLRKTSLDELPQIINVLRGDMAYIGPRPALWNQLDLIDERE